MSNCLLIDISNEITIIDNKYTINNNTIYGVYPNPDPNNNKYYYLYNIPQTKPIGFYGKNQDNIVFYDISNIINIYTNQTKQYTIYVSRGNIDNSYNNGDYFIFYDVSFNIINIGNHEYSNNNPDNYLSNNISNNYSFIIDTVYTFIAHTDFDPSYTFKIYNQQFDYNFNTPGMSFSIEIPNNYINTQYQIINNNTNTSKSLQLNILRDANNVEYYYDSIKFKINQNYSLINNIDIYAKSYYNNTDEQIIFQYNDSCNYIYGQELDDTINILLLDEQYPLFRVITSRLINISDDNYTYYFSNFIETNNTSYNDISNAKYAVYDTTYILLNILEIYAIRFNSDISNIVEIDLEYPDLKIYKNNNNDNDIYYYGNVKFTIKQQNFVETISFESPHNSVNFTTPLFVYNGLSSSVNNIIQQDNNNNFYLIVNEYNTISNIDNTEELINIYNLPFKQQYIEPGYNLTDKFGNIINDYVQTNAPENIEDICYNTQFFYIYYRYYDLLDSSISGELYRRVNINYGPVIDITVTSENGVSTKLDETTTINLNVNSNQQDLDIINDISINVYFFDYLNMDQDGKPKKIYLDYDIEITGWYYNILTTYDNKDNNDYKIYINYLDRNTNEYKLKYTHKQLSLDDTYNNYLPKQVVYDRGIMNLTINNIETQSVTNIPYQLNSIIRLSDSSITFIRAETAQELIKSIDEVNNIISIQQNIDSNQTTTDISADIHFLNNVIYYRGLVLTDNISGILQGTIIDFSFIQNSIEIFTTSSLPTSDKFFTDLNSANEYTKTRYGFVNNNNYKIDTQLIGEYNIRFITRGLNTNDRVYQDFSYVEDYVKQFKPDYTFKNISKSINVKSRDTTSPSIEFYQNSYKYLDNTSTYFIIQNGITKKTIQDISNDLQIFNNKYYLNNIPFIYNNVPGIYVNENSIYPTSLVYNTINESDNPDVGNNTYSLHTIDLFGNNSNLVTLDIYYNTNNINIDLSGKYIIDVSVNDNNLQNQSYKDDGFLINSIFVDKILDYSFNGEYASNFTHNNEYDISFNIDICFDQVGEYKIEYDISYNGNIIGNILRKINIVDDTPPKIYFNTITYNDISNINFATIFSNNDYFKFIDNNNIEFNLNTDINDISLILNSNLTYTVNDNYRNQELSNNIVVQVNLSGIETSNNLLSEELYNYEVIYTVIDTFGNTTSASRYISVRDIQFPIINFINPINDNLIAHFSENNHDFSFSIASTNNQQAYQQLYTIISSYDISDNTSTINDISINIKYQLNSNSDISKTIINDTDIHSIDISNITQDFTITYLISDKQNNSQIINRYVNLIDNIPPIINLPISIQDISYSEPYNLDENVKSISHIRLLDISLDNYEYRYSISYEIIDNQNPSIRYYSNQLNQLATNISDYTITYKILSNNGTQNNIFYNRNFVVFNPGPYIYINNDSITFEAGYNIPDISLLYDVSSYSPYNQFNNIANPNIEIVNISSINNNSLQFSQTNPIIGEYIIQYKTVDGNDIETNKLRYIYIIDTQGPILDILNNSIIIPIGTPSQLIPVLVNQNINIRVTDSGDSTIDYFITSIEDVNSINPQNTVEYMNGNIPISNLSNINTEQQNIGNIYIKFIVFDNRNLHTRLDIPINIMSQDKDPIITPFISIHDVSYNILDNNDIDIINSLLYQDISINYDKSTKTFILEAIEQYDFDRIIRFSAKAQDQFRQDIPSENIFYYNNIKSDRVQFDSDYYIIFTCFDNPEPPNEPNKSSILYRFLIIDTIHPIITLNDNLDTILSDIIINNDKMGITSIIGNIDYPYIIAEISNNNVALNDTRFLYRDSGINIYDIVDKSLNYIYDSSTYNNNNLNYIKIPNIYNYLEVSHRFFRLNNITREQLNIIDNFTNISDISFLTKNGDIDINTIRQSRDISYVEIYTVQDSNYNISYKSKFLLSKHVPPIIIINTTIGGYEKIYHLRYSIYRDSEVAGIIYYDYYDGTNISPPTLTIVKNSKNRTIQDFRRFVGDYEIEYRITNSFGLTTIKTREISVITIYPVNLFTTLTIENNYCIFNGYINNNFEKMGMYLTNNNSGYNITLDNRYLFKFSVNLTNSISITGNLDGSGFYRDTVHIDILDNFDRLSIEVYDHSQNRINILNSEDIIIYNEIASIIEFDKIDYLNNIYNVYKQTFNITVKKANETSQQPSYLIDGIEKQTLNLPFGIYTFNCSHYSNLYNPIFFSKEIDGLHNQNSIYNSNINLDDLDTDYRYIYNKNVYRHKIPGTQDSSVTIILDATTPLSLYYYCKNFKNMGGVINITSNIAIIKDIVSRENIITLNGTVTGINCDICNNVNGEIQDMDNKIFLKIKDRYKRVSNNIIGITQKNFINNVLTDSKISKIVFVKDNYKSQIYNNDLSLSNIHNTSMLYNNYLLDISDNSTKNYITSIDSVLIYNTSSDTRTDNFNLYHEIDLNNIFLKSINNYRSFANRYGFNLDSFDFNSTDFAYLIREYKSDNRFNIYNPTQEQIYLPYTNNKLQSSRLILDNVYDNNITIIVQAYLDIVEYLNKINKQDSIEYWRNKIQDINSKIIARNNSSNMINYNLDDRFIFFEEYNISLFYSQFIPDNPPVNITTPTGIHFFNKALYIKGNILENELSNNNIKEILENRIIFCNRDSTNNQDYITINQQNLYHNISQLNNHFIFHKYDISMNKQSNQQVNTVNRTLKQTRDDVINNNLLLFDMSNLYMSRVEELSFNDMAERYDRFDVSYNISNNLLLQTNIVFSHSSTNSLSYDNSILSQYELTGQSVLLTDLEGRQYQETGVFIIDLNEYFDREIYSDTIPYSNINTQYLIYTIEDISYIDSHLFDIYDLENETYIIYRSKHIDLLNRLKRVLVVYNFYIQFMYYYFKEVFYNIDINNIIYPDITFDGKDRLEEVFERTGIIMQDYQVIQDSESVNEFYVQIKYQYSVFNELYNNMYNLFKDKFPDQYFTEITYLDVFQPEYDKIMELSMNYHLFDLNFQEIWKGFNVLFNIENLTESIKLYNPDFMFDSSGDIVKLQRMMEDFYDLYYELKTREGYYSTKFKIASNLDYIYKLDMYNENSIIKIFNGLKLNYQNLNFELTKILTDVSNGIENYHVIDAKINNVTLDIFTDISNASNRIYNNINYIFTNDNYDTSYSHYLGYLTDTETAEQDVSNNIKTLNNLYNILYLSFYQRFNKLNELLESYYNNNIGNIITQIGSYILTGSKILLRTFYSNSIAMKINIKYNSFLYKNLDLDTVFLDITIPDITPPTIIFDDNRLENLRIFRYNTENSDSVYYNRFFNLIKEIKDIDSDGLFMYKRDNSNNPIYSQFMNSLDTSLEYCSTIDKSYNVILNDNDNRQILIDFSEYKNTENSGLRNIDIRYVVFDVANNKTGITLPVTILQDTSGPIFYYNNNIVNNTDKLISNIRLTEGDDILQLVINDLPRFIMRDTEDINFKEPITRNNVELYNTSINQYQPLNNYNSYIVNIQGIYNDIIKYSKQDNDGNLSILYRGLTVEKLVIEEENKIEKICCYPKANYLDVQHTYKMGSFANRNSELSRIIRLYNRK